MANIQGPGSGGGKIPLIPKYSFNQSKYNKQAQEMFGGFTPYNPPSSSYYRDLGHQAYLRKEEEKKRKKVEKDNELLNKYGISADEEGAFSVKSDDFEEDESFWDKTKEVAFKGLEILDRPADALRTAIKEKAEGDSFLKGLKDGFTGKKNTSGKELNKAIGFNIEKSPTAAILTNLLGKSVKDGFHLKSNDLTKIGEESAGMVTETIVDPLNLLGVGPAKLATKTAKNPKLGLPRPKETLALPEPQRALPAPPKPLKERFNAEGINFGYNTKNAPKPRPLKPLETKIDDRPSSYWQQRYEEFANHVNSSYDKNNLSPEALEDLWSQFAKYDEPFKLEQVVDLAYPKGINKTPTPKAEIKPIKEINMPLAERPIEFRQEKFINTSVSKQSKIKPQYENITPGENPGLVSKITGTNEKDLQNIKDISQLQVGTTDLYRIVDRLPKPMKEQITSSLDNAKKANIDQQEQLTSDLYQKIVKDLGIIKGSKESALIQDFGEKTLVKKYLKKRGIDPRKLSEEELNNINLQQLKKLHPDKWERIVKADAYFRQSYDALIEQVNKVRGVIYPNNPEKIVPKRSDYYHHFNELEGFDGIKNLFDTPANIDPHLEGVSANTKPKTKFQGFMQKRGLGPYKSDAVGGYLKYLKAASHSINIDPLIPILRNSANEIADATVDTRNANKIIEALQDHANDLAGKTNPYDRSTQKITGRKLMALTNWVNSRVKSNMILGNLGSVLGQLGNIPLGIGKAKQHAIPGLKDTVDQTFKEVLKKDKNLPIHQSNFLKERFSDQFYRRFDQRLLDQPKNLAIWLMETADKAGTRFIWNSMYNKGLAQGVKDPIKYADYETRNVIAGRGVAEVPLLQKAKTVQVLAPFTLEVGNQWKVLSEMVGQKDAAGIITFMAVSYGLNQAVEHVRGSGVSFDPFGALLEGYLETDGDTLDKTLGATGSLAGEVIGNIPGGNLITNATISDKKIPFTDIQFQEVFGKRNPNRFGSGLTLSKPFQDPLSIILPFGANQVNKTLKGAEGIFDKGIYKGNSLPFTGEENELKFPIETSPLKNLQMLAFGPNATSEAQEYYKNERRPLSENQTANYEALQQFGKGKEYYNDLMSERRVKTLELQIKQIDEDPELTQEEKRKEILLLMAELYKYKK